MRVFVYTILLLLTPLAGAATQCGKNKAAAVEYAWCITKNPSSQSRDILYYMHGLNQSEQGWEQSEVGHYLTEGWAKSGVDAPTVITISFGATWLVSDFPMSGHAALLPLILDEVMPSLEAKAGVRRGGKRLLMGSSMGGYNSAQLALRAPERFDRVALLCPAIGLNPFASKREVESFLERQPQSVSWLFVRGILAWVKRAFHDPQNWARHDPFALANAAGNATPAFFVSCSKDDELGFFEGAQRFSEIMKAKTESHFVEIESGGHCAQSAESLAELFQFLNEKTATAALF